MVVVGERLVDLKVEASSDEGVDSTLDEAVIDIPTVIVRIDMEVCDAPEVEKVEADAELVARLVMVASAAVSRAVRTLCVADTALD